LATRGKVILICDADMSTPPATLISFLDSLNSGADIVIGNRKNSQSNIRLKQPPIRRILGKGFIWLSTLATNTSISDFNCGFKLFRGDVAREIFEATTTNGWAYDIEMLAIAVRRGKKVVEHPVIWEHYHNSSVRLLQDIVKTLWEMMFVWLKLKKIDLQR
jgi:dolichyl-phosphate beta-glucosyltransferase